jgi:hypothetical protein
MNAPAALDVETGTVGAQNDDELAFATPLELAWREAEITDRDSHTDNEKKRMTFVPKVGTKAAK